MTRFTHCRIKMAAIHASALLATAPVLAQGTAIQLYGTVDLAVGQLEQQPPGPPNAPITRVRGLHNGGMQTSYFGMRGVEDLGGGLKAKFQLESWFRADTGQSSRFNPPGPPQDGFWSRSAWVAVEGRFGELKLGTFENPTFLASAYTSAMTANAIFSPSLRQQYAGATRGYVDLDTRVPNTVQYTTPRIGGVTAVVAVQAAEGSGNGSNYLGNLVYRSGPLVLALGVSKAEHLPPPDPAGPQDQELVVVGGSYDLKVVKLFAQYTTFEDGRSGLKVKTPHVGLTAPIGLGELQLAWARGKNSGSSTAARTTASVIYYYHLSIRTGLYGALSADKVNVGTAHSYLLGIRHTF
jgi:predicted porin